MSYRYRGLKEYRWKDNPEEKRISDAWFKLNPGGSHLDRILSVNSQPCAVGTEKVSARDQTVAATVIQWLGSPVGQGWLRDLGYRHAEAATGGKRT